MSDSVSTNGKKLIRQNQEAYDKLLSYYKRINIFLSSTFEDMSGERDLLVQAMKSSLVGWGREYGLDVNIIDLRWGISVKESEQGRALPLCLRAVDESVPFVISLIGNRKGWVPQKEELPSSIKELLDNPQILEEYKFSQSIKNSINLLRDSIGKKSITEMEIQQALFGGQKQNLLFLVRESAARSEETQDLKDLAYSHGGKNYTAKWNETKKCYEDFKVDGQGMEHFVISYLKAKCMELCPEHFKDPYFLNKRNTVKQYFEYNRRIGTYVFRNTERAMLEDFFRSDSQELTIKGADGSGKRSLMTAFIYELLQYFFVDVVFSYDVLNLETAKYQMAELGRNWNELKGKIDALGKNKPIVFLAPVIEQDVRIAVSNYGVEKHVFFVSMEDMGNSFDVQVKELGMYEIRYILEGTLRKQCRRLEEEQLQKLSKREEFANPKVLKAFLEQMASAKDFREIDHLIAEKVGSEESIFEQSGTASCTKTELMERLTQIAKWNTEAIEKMQAQETEVAYELFSLAYDLNESLPDWYYNHKINEQESERITKSSYRREINSNRMACLLKMWSILSKECEKPEFRSGAELKMALPLEDVLYQLDALCCGVTYEDASFYNSFLKNAYAYDAEVNDYSLLEDYRSKTFVERIRMLQQACAARYSPFYYQVCLRYEGVEDEMQENRKKTKNEIVVEERIVTIKTSTISIMPIYDIYMRQCTYMPFA